MIAAFAAGFQPKPLAFQLADFGGRSGYWRLVFAKMQEEALNPPEKEEAKTEAVVTETRPVAAKTKAVRRSPTTPPAPEIHERPVLPVFVPRVVRTLLDDLTDLKPLDTSPVRIDYGKIARRVAKEEVQRTRRKRRQIEELVLLLAA